MSPSQDPRERIDLKQQFPVSLAFIVRRNVGYLSILLILALIFITIFVVIGNLDNDTYGSIKQFLLLKKLLIGTVLITIGLIRLAYDFLYWLRYDYYIERGRLHIESGVIIRQEASVPLTPLCEFYLEKRWIDLFFGTKDLIMKAAIGEGQEVCRIQAIKDTTAKKFKRFLINQAEKGSIGNQDTSRTQFDSK